MEVLGVPPERVEVVYHGIDQERSSPRVEPADDEIALSECFVVYPANLCPHKNHDGLVEALAAVPDRASWRSC